MWGSRKSEGPLCGPRDLPADPGLCSTLPLLGKSLGLRLPARVWQLLHRTWRLMVECRHISFLVSGTVCGGRFRLDRRWFSEFSTRP